MCGITGYISHRDLNKNVIKRMTATLAHRGPDEEGVYISQNVALGHKRLSIIDLASGQQPMRYENYIIIFNGEIYNFKELRDNLQIKGYTFQTHSDTEVLLKLYAEYKEASVSMLNGMFSFAIWDTLNENLFLVRDRLGIKPLYYTKVNKDFVFASEIKALLQFPGVKSRLNIPVMDSYFRYRYIIGEQTLFEDIFSLESGSFINYSSSQGFSTEKYWKLPIIKSKENIDIDSCISKVRDLVVESVQKRMISDVPLGSYLSGGLDSSIVSSVMAQKMKDNRLDTFTIGFPEEGYNEFKYSKMVAKMWNTNHHEILLGTENYIETMKKLISFKDAPLSVPNEVPLYLMSKELKKYITVVLSGEGADELFGGYGRIFISHLKFSDSSKESYLQHFLDRYKYVKDDTLSLFLQENVRSKIDNQKYTDNVFANLFNDIKDLEIEDKIPYIFQVLHLQGLLNRVDTTTMAASVEARVPFVDHELVEFVNSLPFSYKIRWKSHKHKKTAHETNMPIKDISENLDITKYLLREAFKRDVPEEVASRKKVGFPVPLDDWFKGSMKSYADSILKDKRTLSRGIFDQSFIVNDDIYDKLSGINIWMLINFELFVRQYFD